MAARLVSERANVVIADVSGAAQYPIGRLADVGEIASAALYWTPDDASFITGTALVVDGGLTIA